MKLIDKIKDSITDFIGLIIIIATMTQLWDKQITWIYDGLIGLAVGFSLFMIPDQIIGDSIKRVFNKYLGNDSNNNS